MLLAGAAPLAAAALAAAPMAASSAAAAPPAAHVTAMISGPDCLAPLGGHQAPKLPACLGDWPDPAIVAKEPP